MGPFERRVPADLTLLVILLGVREIAVLSVCVGRKREEPKRPGT